MSNKVSEPGGGTPLIELRGVKKSFGAVQAVNGVDLEIIEGKVTALVGDNGAGKSSLIKTISGLWVQDAGEILWEGKPVRLRSPKDSEALGVTTIYQDLALCDNLDIVQNMFLGHEVLRHLTLDEGAMEITAKKTLAELGVTTVRSVRQPVASLSGGQRQSVAVAKAVMSHAKLVIMDEPTAALGVSQTAQVLALVKRLAANGVTVLMISHNLVDVFEVADRIAILRLGRIVAAGPVDTFDSSVVVDYMTTGRTERALVGGEWERKWTMTNDQGGNVDGPTSGTETKSEPSPVLSSEHHDGHHEEKTPATLALVSVAPEVLADSLGEYTKAWVKRIRGGESGALPILLGLVLIIVIFQVQQSKFLSAGNIVNLLVQAAFFVTLGLGETFALILSEIDLSVGFVAGIGATITLALLSPSYGWPWWAAVIVGLLACAVLGAFQGLLITRLHLPSFVVTLASLLGLGGVLIFLFDSFNGAVGGVISLPTNGPIYDLVNGNMSTAASWIVLVVAVGLYALVTITRNIRRRARNLSAPPLSITLLTIVVATVAGSLLVIVCNLNRGNLVPLKGVPWVLPLVLLLVLAWTLLLTKTRTGRYMYAIGASPEAARRAGIRVQWIRTVAFTLSALTAGLGGLVFASRLGSISVGYDGSTYVLYAIAAAVIGGASLFGGYGKAVHSLLGGVLIAAVVNGLALIGVSTAGEEIATALVLLAAVTVDSLVRRRGATT